MPGDADALAEALGRNVTGAGGTGRPLARYAVAADAAFKCPEPGYDPGSGLPLPPPGNFAGEGPDDTTMNRPPRSHTMTPGSVGPLSRPVDVMNLPPQGAHVRVAATAEDSAALAKDFKLPASGPCRRLQAQRLRRRASTWPAGDTAAITQTCVVTLIRSIRTIEEEVEVDFAEPSGMPAEATDRDA